MTAGRDPRVSRHTLGELLWVLAIAAELVGWFLYGPGATMLIGAAGMSGLLAGWAHWSSPPRSDACLEPLVIVDPEERTR